MKWILIYVLYSHSSDGSNSSPATVSTQSSQIIFDDQEACYYARDSIKSGAFNKSFSNEFKSSSTVTSDAACVPQSSTSGPRK